MCYMLIAVVAIAAITTAITVEQQNQTTDANNKIAANQEAQAQTNAQLQANDINNKAARLAATQTSLFGASGVDAFSGSPDDVYADTASAGAKDVFNVKYAGATTASNLAAAASLSDAQGQGKNVASIFNFASSAVKSYGTYGGGGGTPSNQQLGLAGTQSPQIDSAGNYSV